MPSAGIEVVSSWWTYYTFFHDKCVAYLVEAPTIAFAVFKLMVCGLNSLGEQKEIVGKYGPFL